MRVSLLCFMSFLILSFGAHSLAQSIAQNTFTTNLSLGSSGTQVTTLQQMLNRDPDTRIANTGPGSPGNETSYFGLLTKAAVIRFQEKYASEILVPTGLAQGNGYVGSYTRTKLKVLSAPKTSTASVNTPIAPPVVSTPPPATAPQNPNLKNLDKFLAALDSVGTEQGASAADIAVIKQQVLQGVSTTTDLRATFLKIVQDTSHQSTQNESPVWKILATIEHVFDSIFRPERALAAAATPFGGELLFVYQCCGTYLLTITPLPPSYAKLLTYAPGSQAFLSYNIPITEWLLGEYEPGAGVCQTGAYCAYRPYSDGMITPMTGSSPL